MTIREHNLTLPLDQIADLCRQKSISKLSLFGSALRDDFRPDSDVDLLVEFLPDMTPGLITFLGIQNAFSRLIGRTVDLRTPEDFYPATRQRLEAEAEVLFEE